MKPALENRILCGDCLALMSSIPAGSARLVVADPPYFNVLRKQPWDTVWADQNAYLEWTARWMEEAVKLLVPGGLLFCFGQLGKREHVMLHVMSQAAWRWQFHDLIIWDRVVGYNDRSDSFTPAYEMALVLRKAGALPYFNKDAVREPYDKQTIAAYIRDKRYKNQAARREHLERGKFATNLWRIPSLKGKSREKSGHPSQKPLALIERVVVSCSAVGELVVDPFLGSGTTAVVCRQSGRRYVGIELNPSYADMAQERVGALEKFLGGASPPLPPPSDGNGASA